MRRLLLFGIAFFTLLSLFSKERVVERPPFSVRNYGTLEIEKIVLNDNATVIHFTGYQQPGRWFRIASETYITANGKKHLVESADGLNLDEDAYPDETGKKSFALSFPAIDQKTERIDFIEGDCDDSFKIWGIELKSDVLTNRILVPEELKRLADMKVEGSLKPYGFKNGDACLKGQLLGYHPEMKTKGQIYINNPFTNNQEEYTFVIADDGTFEVRIPMITNMQVFMSLSELFRETILLAPGEETLMYVDLQQKSCQESKTRKDKCAEGKWIFFGGASADINNNYINNNLSQFTKQYFNSREMEKDIEGMSAHQYREYIFGQKDKALQAMREKALPQKIEQFMEINIRQRSMYYLMMGSHFLESAYRTNNGIGRRAAIPGYNKPVFDVEYYQFLKDIDLNNPLNLYSSEYPYSVRCCLLINTKSRRVYTHNFSDIAEELINITEMTPEERAFADYLITQKYENLPADRVEKEKQRLKRMINRFVDSDKATDEMKKEAARINELVSDGKTGLREVNGLFTEFMMDYNQLIKPIEPDDPIFTENQVEDEAMKAFTPDFINAFTEKYKEHTDMLFDEFFRKESRELIVNNLGTDRGLLFDLMLVQQKSSSLEEMVPVSAVKMAKIQKLDNPFYYEYFLARNAEILAKLEENKKNGGYTVYPTPDVENEVLLDEILKAYKGKVVFIDFWNTWCGPCRSAMKTFEPAKQAYNDKDIIFLYLADESSPIKAWENMIPDMHGDHYRLTYDRMNYLREKYGVTGIPSYLVLDKNGEQVYFHVGFPGNQVITDVLNKELDK